MDTAELSSKPLRAAVIGAGFMGRLHAQVLSQLPGVKLCAVVDPLIERAEDASSLALGAKAYADYSEMLEREELDLVTICTVCTDPEELDTKMVTVTEHKRH